MRNASEGASLTLPHVWRTLRGRKFLLLIAVVVSVGIAAAISVLAPKEYVGTVQVVVDSRGNDPLREPSALPQPLTSYLATQAEIIRSRSVALKVVDSRKLLAGGVPSGTSDAEVQALRDRLADTLLRSLEVKTSANSNVIHVSFGSPDPQAAAAMANAFADAYIQTSLELQVDPARRQASWFEEQLAQLRSELVSAQSRLSSYQREHNVLDVDEQRLDVENARLQEVSNHLVNAQSAMFDAETRRQQLSNVAGNRRFDQLPDIINYPVLQSLKGELARAEAKFADLSERYDRNHPQYRSAAAEVESLRRKLASEIEVAKGSLVQSADIARQQVKDLQGSLDEQRQRIIELARQRDELVVLNRDVQSARAAYDAALQQTNQTRLQSRLDRTNIAILNPATVPDEPSFPRPLLNVALGLALGLLLGASVALYIEGLQPRVRAADAFADLDIPVLAELPAAPRQRTARRARQAEPALELRTA